MNMLKQRENIDIRKVTLSDVGYVQTISRQTFTETFSAGNTAENLKMYLEKAFSIDKLSAELSNANSDFYFATLGSKVIGYLKLNFGPSQTEIKDHNALEIERIYVLKEYHGKNVGQLLYEKAIQVAKQTNANYVWLGVWEKNTRAISFNKKKWFRGV